MKVALILFAMIVPAFADEAKRDMQGVALGMSTYDAINASKRPCTFPARDKGYVVCGGGEYDTPKMTISFSRNTQPPVVETINFEFCSKGTFQQVAASTAATYGFAGPIKPTRGNVARFEVNDERIVVGQMSPCDDGNGTKFLVGLTDLKILAEDMKADTIAPGQVTPKL